MNRIRRLCRWLAGLPRPAGARLAFAAAPAAWRPDPPFPPGWTLPPGWARHLPLPLGWHQRPPLPLGHVAGPVDQVPARAWAHAAVTGGMSGWQIAAIAAGAALLAAALAVAAHRRRGPGAGAQPGRRRQPARVQRPPPSVIRHRTEATTMTTDTGPPASDRPATDLVTRARNGDQQAWDALVERYAPLVWSICRAYRLNSADTDDASRNVWLHLVGQLDNIREPAALAGWLATTTRRECARILRAAHSTQPQGSLLDATNVAGGQTAMADDELLRAERHAVLREALTHLPPRCQQLIALLTEDPPVPYAQISAQLGIPVGSIGPCRGRCLDKLRRQPAIAALINAQDRNSDR